MGEILTVRDLKNTFGNKYDVINDLIRNKPDDYGFRSGQVIDIGDWPVCIAFSRSNIRNQLVEYGYDGTDEQVDIVIASLSDSNFNNSMREDKYINERYKYAVEKACENAGFPSTTL